MEILNKKKPSRYWTKEFKCSNKKCRAVLRVSEMDLYDFSIPCEATTYYLTCFMCPKCNHESNIGAIFDKPESRGRRQEDIVKGKYILPT